MNVFTPADWAGTALFALILVLIAYRVIVRLPAMEGDISAFRKRTLVWTQMASILTVLQLNFKAGDWRFAIILGMIVLFAGSIWLAARRQDLRSHAKGETAVRDD